MPLVWSAKRELSKINYRIHTDAIKHNLILHLGEAEGGKVIYTRQVAPTVARLLEVPFWGNGRKDTQPIYRILR